MDVAKLRAWWWSRQGLDGSWKGKTAREVLGKAGWARSVGGSNPYLTLWSRARIGREEADQAVADLDIHELPSARGCTYVLPAEHFALGLALSDPYNEKGDIATGKKWFGVTEEEMDRLCSAILDALGSETLDPNEIRTRAGDAVRSLGEEGKKRGVTSTLPLGLGRLQSRGLIRRVPVNGRLDQQRYLYQRWANPPTQIFDAPQSELARLFFEWIGPASLGQFQWFSGLSQTGAKAAVEGLDLVPVAEGSELMISSRMLAEFNDFSVPIQPSYSLLSSLDSLFLLRRDLTDLMDKQDQQRDVFSERGLRRLGDLQDLPVNAIVDRGRIVGLWEFDMAPAELVWCSFVEPDDALREKVERTQSWIAEDLGDARSFSLDSPASRRPRLAALRELAFKTR
ncbi:MAG: winged helix DNA-binding domain-containing protein [Fimbriimonadaceae bacterium]|nr:winged helix DNA-binding domain-containing protein [Fimbriimonadaceae bacterium]